MSLYPCPVFTWSRQFEIGCKSGCMIPSSCAAVHFFPFKSKLYRCNVETWFPPFPSLPSPPHLKHPFPCMSYTGSAMVVVFLPGGMRYHLLSPEDREELVEGTRPRRKKHDYRIALFGGSQPQSCRYFNPKVIVTSECIKIHCL